MAVLGVGNELMRDDGVGVHAVRRLQHELDDGRVECIEAGTALTDALDLVAPGAHVVVVDAAAGGSTPGSLYRLGLGDLATPRGVSLHERSLPEAVALAQAAGASLGQVVVLGVEPAAVDVGTELSPALEQALPAILDALRAEIARLLNGHPRSDHARR